jgi:sec-independent protein translocase protein TatB
MFDVSFSELMVIGVIALIVIGPERLPKVARTVGHLLGRAQRYVNDVKSDIQREIELDELRKFKSEMEDTAHSLHGSLRETGASLMEPVERLRDELDRSAHDATQAASQIKSEVQNNLPGIPPVPGAETAETDPLVPSATLPLPPVLVSEGPVPTVSEPVVSGPGSAAPEPMPTEPAATGSITTESAPTKPAAPGVVHDAAGVPAPTEPAHKPLPPTGTPS